MNQQYSYADCQIDIEYNGIWLLNMIEATTYSISSKGMPLPKLLEQHKIGDKHICGTFIFSRPVDVATQFPNNYIDTIRLTARNEYGCSAEMFFREIDFICNDGIHCAFLAKQVVPWKPCKLAGGEK